MRPSCRAFIAIPLVAGALVTCAPRSVAQLTVFDPSNLQQNLLSATRALEQINNQVRQLQNQALMLLRSRPLRTKPARSSTRCEAWLPTAATAVTRCRPRPPSSTATKQCRTTIRAASVVQPRRRARGCAQ